MLVQKKDKLLLILGTISFIFGSYLIWLTGFLFFNLLEYDHGVLSFLILLNEISGLFFNAIGVICIFKSLRFI